MGWLARHEAVWAPVSQESMLGLVSAQVAQLGVSIVTEMGAKAMSKAPTILSAKKASDVLRLLGGQLEEPDSVFDSKPWKLNCPNGVVDLRTGKIRDHRETDRFLKVAGVAYDRSAPSGMWRKALLALDPDLANWLRLRFGQAITGTRPRDDRVLFLKGGGSNGKSVFVDAIGLACGGYAATVPPRVLIGSPSDHSTELMTMKGVRVAILEEMPEHHLAGAMLKRIVGPREITARLIGKDNTTFPVVYSLFVTTNYPLRIADVDHGTWRRVTMVPFPYRYVQEPAVLDGERQRDNELKRWSESRADPAVLAWLVQAAVDCFSDMPGFETLPQSVELATNETRSENDLLSVFAEEQLVLDQGVVTTKTELFNCYRMWALNQGQKPVASVVFSQRFKETEMGKHVKEDRGSVGRYWIGVRLRLRPAYAEEAAE